MTVKERVQRGAEFMDENAPGWREKIDLDSLDISLSSKCVLGQIFGSSGEGVDALGIGKDDAVEVGFYAEAATSGVHDEYALLTEEWKAVLSA